ENFYRASRLLVELGFDGIDINFGCPVPKVIKQGCCSAMIENWPLAEEIVLAAREGAGGLPLSIKTRLGLKRWATEEWTNFLLGLKPDVLTIHGRIAVEQSQQPANWGEIAKVVQLRNALGSSTLIIGNGDVGSRREANYKSEQYGVDGVMVGRGIFHDLFLFNSASETRPFMERSIEEKLSLLLQHLDMYLEVHGPESDVRPLKKFFKIYSAHFPRAPELRQRLVEADSAEAVRQIVHERLLEERQLES
ncbi:MAG: tRNA-dihydrouridine synthase, partial [Bacteroidales bacterium]|nr:tRNA-dihydrouridine synthase [Bacteroidales bacterium]